MELVCNPQQTRLHNIQASHIRRYFVVIFQQLLSSISNENSRSSHTNMIMIRNGLLPPPPDPSLWVKAAFARHLILFIFRFSFSFFLGFMFVSLPEEFRTPHLEDEGGNPLRFDWEPGLGLLCWWSINCVCDIFVLLRLWGSGNVVEIIYSGIVVRG